MTNMTEWRGSVGDVWAREWRRTDRSFANLSRHLDAAIRAAAPESGRVLDIGCGAGATSLALAAALPALHVTGVDLSEGLIAVARERARDRPNLRFHVADAGDPNGPLAATRFDLLVSRHGVMFFADPVAGFTALRARAAADARIVFSCFRSLTENPWATDLVAALTNSPPPAPATYAPGPFALADRDATATILGRAGWVGAEATAIDFTYVAGAGPDPVAEALAFFTRIGPAARALADAPHEDRPALLDRLSAILARHITDGAVTFSAAAWIWCAGAAEARS